MADSWIGLEEVARQRSMSLAEARALALKMHWPCLFRRGETLVLRSVSKP